MAEHIVAANSATQAVWLRRMLEELQHRQDLLISITLTKNPKYLGCSKHIDI